MFDICGKQERSPSLGLLPVSVLPVIHMGFLEVPSILYNVYQWLRWQPQGTFGGGLQRAVR